MTKELEEALLGYMENGMELPLEEMVELYFSRLTHLGKLNAVSNLVKIAANAVCSVTRDEIKQGGTVFANSPDEWKGVYPIHPLQQRVT